MLPHTARFEAWPQVGTAAPPRARQRRRIAVQLTTLVLLLAGLGALTVWHHLLQFETEVRASIPRVVAAPPYDTLFDHEPVAFTITANWERIPTVATTDQLLKDHTLWARMHIGDWDTVPSPLRERGLRRLIERYSGTALSGPVAWAGMSTADWDTLPQPVRAMAFLRMIWYWSDFYRVGEEFGIEPSAAAQTIGAIVMAESWFEHRAFNENPWGNRDLGLAQCSDHCREVLGLMWDDGHVDFRLSEEAFYNPWYGTRVAAFWYNRELRRSEGDVELAIRAYHRGLDNALRGEGAEYLENVLRLRRRYVLNQDAPPTWTFLAAELAGVRTGQRLAAAPP